MDDLRVVTFPGYAKNVLAAMVMAAIFVVGALAGIRVKWLISERRDATETPCPTCGRSAGNATTRSTTGGSR